MFGDDSGEEDWSVAWDENDVQSSTSSKIGTSLMGSNAPQKFVQNDKSDVSLLSRMQLNDNKAGMEGLDKEKINQIIYEASKGSRYYENELKREEQVNKRILEQKAKMYMLTKQNIKEGELLADGLLQELESSRSFDRVIVHIDMDAFYAAVEMRDQPSLKDKPMAVGGNSMLCTSNYVARKYGVRAAMPGFIGKKLCPQLIIVPTDFDKYTAVSKQVREIMADYDPNYCPMSLDEAYLDFTEHLKVRRNMTEQERSFPKVRDLEDCACRFDVHNIKSAVGENIAENKTSCDSCGLCVNPGEMLVFGCDANEAVREMRHRIHLRTRLTASAGIAPNTMLSKVCSDKHKPNGQYRIEPDRETVMEFVKDLPIRKVSGIGKVSEKMLSSIGVVTCSDLYAKRGLLYHLYSNISYNYFMRICLGLGSTEVCRDGERKSLSTERTFREINKPEELFSKCGELCQDIVQDLQKEQILGKTIGIKLKTVKFELKTRAMTISDYTKNYEQIFRTAKELLNIEINACHPQPLRLRLMGVRISSIISESEVSRQTQNRITNFLKKKSECSPNKSSNGKEDIKNEDAGTVENSLNPAKQKGSVKTLIQRMTEKSPCKKTEKSECSIKSPNTEMSDNVEYEHKNIQSKIKEEHSNHIKDENGVNFSGENNECSTILGTGNEVTSRLCSSVELDSQDIKPVANIKRIKSVESIQCPVCSRTIKSSSANVINNHIDYCLVKMGNIQEEKEENETKIHEAPYENVEESILNENSAEPKHCRESFKADNSGERYIDISPDKSDDDNSEILGNLSNKEDIQEALDNTEVNQDNNINFQDDLANTEVNQTNNRDLQDDLANTEVNQDNNRDLQDDLANTEVNQDNNRDLQDDFANYKANEDNSDRENAKELVLKQNYFNSDISEDKQIGNREYCKADKMSSEESRQQSDLMLPQTSTGGVGYDSYPLICPVCNVSQYEMDLSEFNQHVDSCLSKKAIKEILHKNTCSTSSVHNNNNKRTIITPNKGKAPKQKRRKIEKGLQTLESFVRTDNC